MPYLSTRRQIYNANNVITQTQTRHYSYDGSLSGPQAEAQFMALSEDQKMAQTTATPPVVAGYTAYIRNLEITATDQGTV